jgi:hypothetical protein
MVLERVENYCFGIYHSGQKNIKKLANAAFTLAKKNAGGVCCDTAC